MTTQTIQCRSCFAKLDTLSAKGSIVTCEYCGIDNMLGKEVRQVLVDQIPNYRLALYKALTAHFSLQELRTFCDMYNLVQFDTLGGEGVTDKARELVLYVERHAKRQALLDALLIVVPHVDLR